MSADRGSYAEVLDRLDAERAQQRGALAEFLGRLRTALAEAWIAVPGRPPLTLARYLAEAERGEGLSGDEQAVVDQVVRRLLFALGYAESEFSYNRAMRPVGARAVPDYTVFVPEIPNPLFVVEDKATAVRDLDRPRRGHGGKEESSRAQLRRYALSGAVHGRAGLLCNGFVLEAWEFGGEADTRTVHLDLQALAGRAEGPADDFAGPQAGALEALHARFARTSFAQSLTVGARALHGGPLPAEWRQRVHDVLATDPTGPGIDAVFQDYYLQSWQARAVDVRRHPALLADALRGLIELLVEDVRHQLEDGLLRFAAYERRRAETRERADLSRLRKLVVSHYPEFGYRADEVDPLFLLPLDRWCETPHRGSLKRVLDAWVAEQTPRARAPSRSRRKWRCGARRPLSGAAGAARTTLSAAAQDPRTPPARRSTGSTGPLGAGSDGERRACRSGPSSSLRS